MPQEQQLVWPTPPHHDYADAQAARASSDCLIAFFDGRKLFGNILRFLPEEEVVEFRPMQNGKVLQVPFDEIKNLRLIRPVAFRSRDIKPAEKGAEVVEVSSNQKFTVEFRDGERLMGETRGFVNERHGLYLYLAVARDEVVRCFIPSSAHAAFSLGPSLGQMLIAENAATPAQVEAGFELQQEMRTQRIGDLASKLIQEARPVEAADRQVTESDNTLVPLVNKMITDAYEQGVSDIHIESLPGSQGTQVRFRKDGAMLHYLDLPTTFRNALISRIKIMAELDISDRRRPQDGKIDFQQFGPAKIELRVATMPTANGLEDVVMRVLAAAEPLPIDRIGLAGDILINLKRTAEKPHGLFLICGPTGSGKTTTLHSVLGYINIPDRKIWTAEDPIEITQSGLRQVQVNPKIGLTFAAAMRSFLRLDPDVIMVGEMRDAETARTGIEASLTGHLVFSTLHTNSAAESVVRLLDFGMDPFNFADALLGVLSQRLARTLCAVCKQPYEASDEEINQLLNEYQTGTPLESAVVLEEWRSQYANEAGKFTLQRAAGCTVCDDRGYRGRIGLHELLLATPAIKKLIHRRATVDAMLATAIKEGMRTLKQDGIEKILQGHTDVAQIRAVTA
ncbi:MAG: GspE/PulE family protein [Pseudomonadota bacterium]